MFTATVGAIAFIAGLAYAAWRLKGDGKYTDVLKLIVRKGQ